MSKFRGGGNAPAIIIKQFELLDTKTDKTFVVSTRELYEKFLRKESGRYIKAG